MNRRDFLKGTLFTTAILVSEKSLAGEYKEKEIEGRELLRLKNRDKPSVLEQKHVPAVEAPDKVHPDHWFDVKVKVGFMKEHPSTPNHWITMIKLLVDDKLAAKTEFKIGGVSSSSATFRIRLQKTSTIEAVENCNLHGTWISDPVRIKVM